MAPTKLVLPYGRIPPKWDPNTAREINEDFQGLVNFVNALKAQVDNITIVTPAGTRGADGRPGFDGVDGVDGVDAPVIPGPPGPQGPTGPTGPAGSGGGGGATMPYHEEYVPDDFPDLFQVPGAPGPQGPQGATGAAGATGPAGPAGGGGVAMPYFPDSFIPDDSPELLPIPGMALASQIAAQAATVSWGTPSSLALDADFTFSSDGVVVLYNTISQGGTFKINGSVIGGVATNQSSTCSFPYSSGQTGHVVSGLTGSGLVASYYPFTGGCGWGSPVSLTVSSSFTQTAHGLVLIYNSNNQSMTFTMGGVNYAELFTDLNDSVGVPYIAGSTAVVTGGGGTGLVAHYYPFTGNGAWTAPVSLSLNTNFTETTSGMMVGYNSGNQGATLFENGANIGGVFNSNHHAGNFPHNVAQTANLTTVGGSGFLAWFFALPSAGGSTTVITGGNVNSNLSSATIGTPAVFADTSGKLITSTSNRLTLVGTGNPQGVLAAAVGYTYIDTSTGVEYVKLGGGSTQYGWYRTVYMGAGAGGAGKASVWNMWPINNASSAAAGAVSYGPWSATWTGAVSVQGLSVVNGRTYKTFTSTNVSGNITNLSSPIGGATTQYMVLDGELDMTIDMLTGPSVASMRFWFGLSSVAIVDTDTLGSTGTGGIFIRFSTVAGDGGFVGATQLNGAGNQTVTATLNTIAANTEYRLRIRFVRTGTPTAYFSVNDGTEVAVTTNIPATGNVYSPLIGVITKTTAAQTLGWRHWGATFS